MLIAPGGNAIVQFQCEFSGELVALTDPAAVIYRGAVLTSIVPTISNPSTGIYYVTFAVPSNWTDYDAVSCQLSGTVSGKPIACLKSVGTVLGSINQITAQLDQLHDRQGLKLAVTADVQDPIEGVPGYVRTSNNSVDQVLTKNPDGSVTIGVAP